MIYSYRISGVSLDMGNQQRVTNRPITYLYFLRDGIRQPYITTDFQFNSR